MNQAHYIIVNDTRSKNAARAIRRSRVSDFKRHILVNSHELLHEELIKRLELGASSPATARSSSGYSAPEGPSRRKRSSPASSSATGSKSGKASTTASASLRGRPTRSKRN